MRAQQGRKVACQSQSGVVVKVDMQVLAAEGQGHAGLLPRSPC